MSSTIELRIPGQMAADPWKLWEDGEAFANHPRVRLAHLGDLYVTMHRYGSDLPSGLRVLIADPDLAAIAGLRFAGDGLYAMDFISGDEFNLAISDAGRMERLVQTMVGLWRRSPDGLPEADRERPVLGPMTRSQYVSMPDAVLASAFHHEPVVAGALRCLAERGPGRSIIHGDLKTDNVICSDGDEIKFIDWECCGAGHPEDDVASLLASVCAQGLGRAVRYAQEAPDGRLLSEQVAQELDGVRRFSNELLGRLRQEAPVLSTKRIGEAFLVSVLCRFQGTLFVPSGEALRLTMSEFVTRSMERGPTAVREWLLSGGASSERGEA